MTFFLLFFENSLIFKWDPFRFSHYLSFLSSCLTFHSNIVVVVVVSLFIFGYGELNNGPMQSTNACSQNTKNIYIMLMMGERTKDEFAARNECERDAMLVCVRVWGRMWGKGTNITYTDIYILPCIIADRVSPLYRPSRFHLYALCGLVLNVIFLKIDRFKLHGDGGKLTTTHTKTLRNDFEWLVHVCKLR